MLALDTVPTGGNFYLENGRYDIIVSNGKIIRQVLITNGLIFDGDKAQRFLRDLNHTKKTLAEMQRRLNVFNGVSLDIFNEAIKSKII